ncbi:replication initiator [Nocardia asteroides]|uniref:replication initiator n=1 Tax=Nocardia asteroides TaxID=1824 RepID=UPI001E5438E8|nr:replication initiator [Nocardia asteroides]UGT53778.1 replication initiator protein [Nocardia asteroides]
MDNSTATADGTMPAASLGRMTAAERRAMPSLKDIAEAAAEREGVCARVVPMRAVNDKTGRISYIGAPCKCRFESVCPACAKAYRLLRATQLREGWCLSEEPVDETVEPTKEQTDLLSARAHLFDQFRQAREDGDDETAESIRALVAEIDAELRELGVKGRFPTLEEKPRRKAKSTRRRQDVPNLPRRKVEKRTVGEVFNGYQPSTFLTLTLPSYGAINRVWDPKAKNGKGDWASDGSPVDPDTYDYSRAARDAIHFAALYDRWVQNLRRAVGWNVQLFASVEPQKRAAPHLHIAIRGSVSNKMLKAVTAATYRQIWWPHFDREVYSGSNMPVWDYEAGTFTDPKTGVPLTSWDDALAVMDEVDDLEPAHVIRFGVQDKPVQVLGGTDKMDVKVRYLVKYLTKSVGDLLDPPSRRVAEHYDRLHAEMCVTPCSPKCGVWLRYGIVPKGASEKTQPGRCKAKAHRREFLGLPGRRVLVSKLWTGKTLPDHKAERQEFVRQQLAAVGIEKPDTSHIRVYPVPPGDPDAPPREHLVMAHANARQAWRIQYTNARMALADDPPGAPISVQQSAAA